MIVEKRRIIIDTDCASDDAVAIMMAMREPSVEVMMFSAVCGNVPMEQALLNTLTSIEYANTYFPPVYAGCKRPLLRKAEFAFDTHGGDGLGDLDFAPRKLKAAEGNGITEMLKLLRESEQDEIEIVTLGPLTNIAVAIMLDFEAMKKAKRISAMGTSGLGHGNVSSVAEFNIWHDAEAAKLVLDSGLPILFIGWDACLGDSMFEEQELDAISNSGEAGRFAVDCNKCLLEMNMRRFGRKTLDMADPAAMAAVLCPECVKTCESYPMEVDAGDGPGYGAVLVDRYSEFGKPANAKLCTELKADVYKAYVLKVLSEHHD